MNVFGTIKEKISNVPQNISAGLKSLTSREDEHEDLSCDGVSVNAGAELLNKFQECWAQIHEDSEINAKKAEEVDSTINHFYLEIERQNDTMNEFLSHTSCLPEIVLSLDAAMELIGELNGKVSDLESNLTALEDLCEDAEIQRNRELHLNELKLYRERKTVEIEQVKAKLARGHADRAAAHESKLQATLQEKQAIFEGTYTEAMEDYKLFGQSKLNTPAYLKQAKQSGSPDLSSITLEQDTSALDAFLGSDAEKSESEDQATTDTEKDAPKEAAQVTDKGNPEKCPIATEPEAGDASTQVKTETKSPESETETKTKPEESENSPGDSEAKSTENATESVKSETNAKENENKIESETKTGTETETEHKVDHGESPEKVNNNDSKEDVATPT